jgi:type IV pilus biogenesis protein CpaD/CtpE
MKRLFNAWFYCALLAPALACASGSSPNAGATPDRVDPPQMVSRASPPDLRVPTNASGRPSVRVSIEVMVDDTGTPDMATFKVTGPGAAENHDSLARWIQTAVFRPAHRDGQAVAGLFKTKMEAKIVRR